ncbi:DUF2750 domain-containing protein [Phycicoccus flavus]|uniref:DUF2750 domain-containing protein n=1 Tax=Phycicoccus flavus TaxID=2502783 RepID=UPI000FEBC94E|nr:DUF2750 domain-containing protein [Phycicoccus flavus]NHA68454.1 DUF2750 domain-containing protein [Phycicoccus flavus]
MSAADLHAKAFFEEAVDRGAVWLLRTDDDRGPGYARAGTASGEVALGVWSTERRAAKIASTVPAYAKYRAERVELADFLDRWIPELDQTSTTVGLNWSGPRAQGARVMTYAVVRGIRQRQWELDAPEREKRRKAEWGS